MPIARMVFAGLLLAMAAGQLLSLPEFVEAVAGYSVGGLAGTIAGVLLVGEIAAGIGLLLALPRTRVVAGWIGLAVSLVWAALALQAFGRGLSIENCGCFGRFLAQRLSWLVLIQDGYFVILALLALRSARSDAPFLESEPAISTGKS